MVLLVLLHLGASAALQSNEISAYAEEDLPGTGSTSRNIAAALNVLATLVACILVIVGEHFTFLRVLKPNKE